jgi:hypothetical protein
VSQLGHWTEEEDHYVGSHRATMRLETIARKLGRSPHAVYQRRYWPTRDEYLTSGEASRISGYSSQYLTSLARRHKVKAHRVPGGRWWLFNARHLIRKACAASAAAVTPASLSTRG